MSAFVFTAALIAAQPRPFMDTTHLKKNLLRSLDEIIYTDGARGETRVTEIVRRRDGYVVRCVVGRTRIDVPVSRLRAVLFCDGSRLQTVADAGAGYPRAGSGARADAEAVTNGRTAINRAGKGVPCEPIRIWRLKDTFMIDYRASRQTARNHLYRFVQVPLDTSHVMRAGSEHIVEGWGYKRCHLGLRREEIIRLFGEPGVGSTGQWLNYRATMDLDFFLSGDGCAGEVRFNPGFSGRLLTSGYGLSSPMQSVLDWYGKPKREQVCRRKEDMGFESEVLYILGRSARIEYRSWGVLFWFGNGRVSQIVVGVNGKEELYMRPAAGDAPRTHVTH